MRLRTVVTMLLVAGCETTAPDDGGAAGLDAGLDGGVVTRRDGGPPRDADCAVDAGVPATPDATVPECCTDAICAGVAQACDPATCRCTPVPCAADGPSCTTLLPLVVGDLVCAMDRGGTCFARAASYRTAAVECPAGIPYCVDAAEGCLCGLGCRPFFDDCEPGVRCQLDLGDRGSATVQVPGYCRGGDGRLPTGAVCDSSVDCPARHVCRALTGGEPTCVPVDCGLTEGAPSCAAPDTCVAIDAWGMIGTCAVTCDAWDLGPTCPDGQRCAERETTGLGLCTAGADPRTALGERCDGACGPGLDCVNGVCLERCDPGVAGPLATGACSGAEDCLQIRDAWRPVCAAPCDPFGTEEACGPSSHCGPALDACGAVIGHCLPGSQGVEGGPCGDECNALGLVCSEGATARCRRLCPLPGDPAGCREDERCFSIPDPDAPSRLLPYGFCARPCAPGEDDCTRGVWCEPREVDPSSGAWLGVCDE